MNTITEARTDVAEAVAGTGITTYPFIPSQIDGAAAIVTPASPYVTPGQTLGAYRVSLNIRLLQPQMVDNQVISESLDDAIVNVCDALRGYGVVQVSQPGIDSQSYSVPYLVTDITITTEYN